MGHDETLTLLPDNATAFEDAQSAVDGRLNATDTDIIRRQREPATCTATFLPFLAWERSLHHWTGTDVAVDRARVASSFADHAGYGSPVALAAEIGLDLGYADVAIRSWWEVAGFAWPDFAVVVTVVADGPVAPGTGDVRASALQRKNVRDWPGLVLYEAHEVGPLGIGSASVLNGVIRLLPADPQPSS